MKKPIKDVKRLTFVLLKSNAVMNIASTCKLSNALWETFLTVLLCGFRNNFAVNFVVSVSTF